MNVMAIQLGQALFRFENFADWVNHTKSKFRNAGVGSYEVVCIDATGHICTIGKYFKDADYPITVYRVRDTI